MISVLIALLFTVGCQDELVSVPPDEVTPFPTTLEVEPSSVTLAPNDTAQVSAEPVDASGNVVPDQQVNWTSEDTSVAIVISDGTVVGIGAGSTQVVAYTEAGSDSLAAWANVTVTQGDSTGTIADPAPTTGTIAVSAATSGSDQDPDGYSISLGGVGGQSITPNGTVSFPALEAGDYAVELTGVQANCSVEGDNPRTVSVAEGDTASTAFSTNCEAITDPSAIEVSTETTGDDADASGYTVTVDGDLSEPIDPNGTVSFPALEAGDYAVELTGVQANCSVEGDNPRTVSVAEGDTASTAFSISCQAIASESATIEVSAVTSGEGQDNDGYTITVDGDLSEPIDPNGTVSFPALEAGQHTIDLSGIAGNCSVSGQNPRTLSVDAGSTASTTFSVSCEDTSEPTTESASVNGAGTQLTIVFSEPVSRGNQYDDDQWSLTQDGTDVSITYVSGDGTDTWTFNLASAAFQGATLLLDQSAGDFDVVDAAGNDLSAFDDFEVANNSTQPGAGDLNVTASTTGSAPDADGYTVTVDGAGSRSISPNGTAAFPDLDAGDYTVELTGVANNCSVDGANPRTVSVDPGNNASATFSVRCNAAVPTLESATINSAGSQITLAFDQAVTLGPNHSDSDFPNLHNTPDTNPTFTYSEGDGTAALTFTLSEIVKAGVEPILDYNQPGNGIEAASGGGDLSTFDDFAVTNNSTQRGTQTGDLEVSAATSGSDQDADGYTVTVDGAGSRSISPNGTAAFPDLDAGDYTVELTGVANNCSVDGANPRTVSVDPGNNASATFSVRCEAASTSRETTLWETEEWEMNNPSYRGNPFDVIATVTFNHQGSSKSRTTHMYYDGNNRWQFRFTGTRTGTWTYTTSSADSDLDGHSGTISVLHNPDPEARGFVTQSSEDPKKWAWQKAGGDEDVFVPQLVMWRSDDDITANASIINADIQTFIKEHGFNGFHVPVMIPSVWFNEGNPKISTFEKLETVISMLHDEGALVYLWIWGDAQRGWAPPGGWGSTVDKRLQRYIAARLGPLPGWAAGYGFDLWEWVNRDQIEQWHRNLHDNFGWPHMLGARGSRNQLDQWSGVLDFSSYEFHQPDYNDFVRKIDQRPGKPTGSMNRFRIGRYYTPEKTRRGLYYSTMVGGVANIWGNLENGGSYQLGSAPYPNRHQIKTYSTFFFERERFRVDMQRNNAITNGYALESSSRRHYIFYKESTSSIQVDLSGMSGSQTVIAVDTKGSYQERNLGSLNPGNHTIQLPHSSDWVIAIGDF
jgi:hypothetical protein